MVYPDATILHNAIHYNNENVTFENSTESVAIFSPRLTLGAKISVDELMIF